MAFVMRNLAVHGQCNNFTEWHYKACNDTIEEVDSKNFFAEVGVMFMRNDVIIIAAIDGVAQRYVVSANADNVIIAPLKM